MWRLHQKAIPPRRQSLKLRRQLLKQSKLNRGIGYEYAHDFPKHFSKQRYLPEELGDIRFYQPSGQGYEETIRRYLDWLHEDLTEDSTGNYHHRQSSK